MQSVLGRSEVETGLLLTPWPLATMVMAPLAGYLIERVHAGLLGALGLAMMACGLFALAMLPTAPTDADIIWRMALCGAGFGLFQSPNNHTIISSAPRQRSGGASGMLGTARLLGQSSGRHWWRYSSTCLIRAGRIHHSCWQAYWRPSPLLSAACGSHSRVRYKKSASYDALFHFRRTPYLR
jgi:MFS family permease